MVGRPGPIAALEIHRLQKPIRACLRFALSTTILTACAASGSPPAGASASADTSPAGQLAPEITSSFSIPELNNAGPFAVTDDAAWVRLLDGSVLQIDLASGEVLRAVPVGTGEFGDVAAGDEAIWVTTFDENTVTRIDPLSGEIVAVVEVGGNSEGVLVSGVDAWGSNHREV